jgi:uncharacterized iron-regulated membrane protein
MATNYPATHATLHHRLRRVWFQVHLWIGVILALPVIVLGLSGTALVFSQELGRALAPQRYQVSGAPAALPASTYLAAARTALGDRARPSELRYPYKPGDPVTVTGRTGAPDNPMGFPGRGASSLTVWMEPRDAKVLDVADPRGGPVSFIHRLHGSLAITPKPGEGPGVGRLIVGWLGVALTVSSLTGLWLWWPRGAFGWGKLGRAFAWRRTPLVLDNLHHFVGFWLCLPLLLLSLTGMYIAFPTQSHALFGAPPPRSPQRQTMEMDGAAGRSRAHGDRRREGPDAPTGPAVGIDQAIAAATAGNPAAQVQVVTLPSRRQPAWKIEFADQRPSLLVDAATALVSPAPPEPVRSGDPISRWMRQTHEGEGYGEVWKWLTALTGLAPALLGVTGVILWWTKRQRRKAIARAA